MRTIPSNGSASSAREVEGETEEGAGAVAEAGARAGVEAGTVTGVVLGASALKKDSAMREVNAGKSRCLVMGFGENARNE